jgi:predicted heme/steroid binding protein
LEPRREASANSKFRKTNCECIQTITNKFRHRNIASTKVPILKPVKEQSKPPEVTAANKNVAQKILRTVPYEQGFHFATNIGAYTKETAINLFSFYEELKTIELQSIKFHFQRRDFQKWIETTLEDPELSSRIDKTPSGLSDEEIKTELLKTIQERLIELQTAANAPTIIAQETNQVTSQEAPKKFNLDELKQFDGLSGKPAYTVFQGKVFDVTDSIFWQGGNHLGSHQAGKDLTKDIQAAPHGGEVLSKFKQVGVIS